MFRSLSIIVTGLIFLLTTVKAQNSPEWSSRTLQLPKGVPPQLLPDNGSKGAQLETKFCVSCHGIPSPASHSASDWVPVMRRMVLRMERVGSMGMMGGMMGKRKMGMQQIPVPNESEQQEILSYLQNHGLKSVSKEKINAEESHGAKLFVSDCKKCHALPDPEQHSAADWPGIVTRMRTHLKQYQLKDLSDQDAEAIITWLQEHAGKLK